MHATCLHCTRPLGANAVLETLPIGRRIAFDAAHGRLWVVCRHCAKWNLVPFDTRLETIDAAERLFSDTRMRYSTDNIGLARVPEGLELVRIGPALRPEFAAWRYGDQYRRRRRAARGRVLAASGVIAAASVTTGFAVGAPLLAGGLMAAALLPYPYLFAVARPFTQMKIPRGRSWYAVSLSTSILQHTTLVWRDEGLSLEVPSWSEVGVSGPYGGMPGFGPTPHVWRGVELRTIGRRVMGLMNLRAGTERHVADASALVGANGGDLRPFLHEVATTKVGAGKGPRYLFSGSPSYWRDYSSAWLLVAKMPPAQRLAFELWLNEDIERTWLEGELKLLEREWQVAETLAKITDGLALEHAQEPTWHKS